MMDFSKAHDPVRQLMWLAADQQTTTCLKWPPCQRHWICIKIPCAREIAVKAKIWFNSIALTYWIINLVSMCTNSFHFRRRYHPLLQPSRRLSWPATACLVRRLLCRKRSPFYCTLCTPGVLVPTEASDIGLFKAHRPYLACRFRPWADATHYGRFWFLLISKLIGEEWRDSRESMLLLSYNIYPY